MPTGDHFHDPWFNLALRRCLMVLEVRTIVSSVETTRQEIGRQVAADSMAHVNCRVRLFADEQSIVSG